MNSAHHPIAAADGGRTLVHVARSAQQGRRFARCHDGLAAYVTVGLVVGLLLLQRI